jgi:transcriptional regulator with XRE-family HTH domain
LVSRRRDSTARRIGVLVEVQRRTSAFLGHVTGTLVARAQYTATPEQQQRRLASGLEPPMSDDQDTQEQERQQAFARNLRAARERAHLTQVDMAEAMKMSETVYARYEAAKTWPSIGSLRRLCQILNCSADWLLALDDTPGPAPSVPPQEPLAVRRLRRQLRHAQPRTRRMVKLVLDELQERGRLPPPDHENRKNRGRLPPPDDDE